MNDCEEWLLEQRQECEAVVMDRAQYVMKAIAGNEVKTAYAENWFRERGIDVMNEQVDSDTFVRAGLAANKRRVGLAPEPVRSGQKPMIYGTGDNEIPI